MSNLNVHTIFERLYPMITIYKHILGRTTGNYKFI